MSVLVRWLSALTEGVVVCSPHVPVVVNRHVRVRIVRMSSWLKLNRYLVKYQIKKILVLGTLPQSLPTDCSEIVQCVSSFLQEHGLLPTAPVLTPQTTTLVLTPQPTRTTTTIQTRAPPRSTKDIFRALCASFLPAFRALPLPSIPPSSAYEAVFIEFRELPHLEVLVRNMIRVLGEPWMHTIVCGTANESQIRSWVSALHRPVRLVVLPVTNQTLAEYNDRLLSVSFWEMLKGDKVLIYQEDTFVFTADRWKSSFLDWDYIGAPFPKTQCVTSNGVGNGGLSLRTRARMIQVLSTVPVESVRLSDFVRKNMRTTHLHVCPEDVYFAQSMQEHALGRVADWDSAFQFSSEQVHNPQSWGMHGMWFGCAEWQSVMKDHLTRITAPSAPSAQSAQSAQFAHSARITPKTPLAQPARHISAAQQDKLPWLLEEPGCTCYVIVSEHMQGGSVKYVTDLGVCFGEQVRFVRVGTVAQLRALSKQNQWKADDLVIVQPLFLTDITVRSLIQAGQECPSSVRWLLPLHDWYWLTPTPHRTFEASQESQHTHYLVRPLPPLNGDVLSLMTRCDRLICPSQFVHSIFSEVVPDAIRAKLLVRPHMDLNLDVKGMMHSHSPHIPPIKNRTIHVGMLSVNSVCKGSHAVEWLQRNVTSVTDAAGTTYAVRYWVHGQNVRPYQEHEFYDLVRRLNIHCLLFLNQYGETWCYSLTKALWSRLPLLYNNIGAFRERLVASSHCVPVAQQESECADMHLLQSRMIQLLRYILECAPKDPDLSSNVPPPKVMPTLFYTHLFHQHLFRPCDAAVRSFPRFSSSWENQRVVVITSKIVCSSVSYTYSPNRSIYTTQERFEQTLETIASVREHLGPQVRILLVDNSVLPEQMKARLVEDVDGLLNDPSRPALNVFTDALVFKGYGELAQLLHLFHGIPEVLQCRELYKLSGRYVLRGPPPQPMMDARHQSVFKLSTEPLTPPQYHYTCFYKIVANDLLPYYQALLRMYYTPSHYGRSMEVIIPEEMQHQGCVLQLVPQLNVQQRIACWENQTVI